jgi:site-specific recombinase XerD
MPRYAKKTYNLNIAAIKTYYRLVHNRYDVSKELPRIKEDKFLPWVLSRQQVQMIIDGEYIPTMEELADKRWRLSNLYYINDKSGNQIKFNLNNGKDALS